MKNMHFIKIGILTLSAMWCFTSCKQEVKGGGGSQNTFYKFYGTEIPEVNAFVATTEGGYLTIGINNYWDENNMFLNISSLDESGDLNWSKDFEPKGYYILSRGIKLKNGDFIANHIFSSNIVRISSDGAIKYQKQWNNSITSASIFNMSRFIEGDDGNCYVSYTNGASQGNQETKTRISQINPETGTEQETFSYLDKEFGGKILFLDIVKAFASGTDFLTIGTRIKYNPWWSWGAPKKTILNKMSGSTIEKQVVINEENSDETNIMNCFTPLAEGGFILVTGTSNWVTINYDLTLLPSNLEVRKFDDDLNEIWKTDLDIGLAGMTMTNMFEDKSGELILSGFGLTSGTNKAISMAVKLTSSGELTLSKIFEVGDMSELYGSCASNDGGGFVFTGSIKGHGSGNTEEDRFIIKTDRNFEYE